MTNKEKLIDFVLRLSNEEAELILNNLVIEKKAREETVKIKPLPYHRTIYSIKHNVTGREYIGSSKNPKQRIQRHLAALRGGYHTVEDMQSDFDKYGEDYTISVLEEITDFEKRHREYDLMEEHKSYIRGEGYNYKDTIFKRSHRSIL
jgi:hypothetical protein